MRVISGKFKGRRLFSKKGQTTRPTLDRTKETLFNILRPDLEDANCLDLFAGSGQIGIEMLSNHANSCVFVDNDREMCEILKQNLQLLELQQTVLCCDFRTALQKLKGQCFHLIFADPPYGKDFYNDVLEIVSTNQLLDADGQIVCESNFPLANEVGNLQKFREKSIGSVYFSFFNLKER